MKKILLYAFLFSSNQLLATDPCHDHVQENSSEASCHDHVQENSSEAPLKNTKYSFWTTELINWKNFDETLEQYLELSSSNKQVEDFSQNFWKKNKYQTKTELANLSEKAERLNKARSLSYLRASERREKNVELQETEKKISNLRKEFEIMSQPFSVDFFTNIVSDLVSKKLNNEDVKLFSNYSLEHLKKFLLKKTDLSGKSWFRSFLY